jgi:adenine-specific DNA-methyltransferase
VEHNKKGVQGDGFSFTNEFAIFVTPALKGAVSKYELPKDQWEYSNLRNWGGESLRTDGRTCFYPIYVKDRKIIGYGDVCDDDEHPASANVRQADGSIAIYPIDAQGVERKWRYAFDTVKGIHDLLRVEVARNGDLQIMKAQSEASFKTMWYDSRYNAGDYGTRILTEMGFPPGLFDFPKSVHLVRDCVNAVASKSSIILDYFAGSGTTAHSVVALNRADGGTRRYIMIEQGEYFDTVLKPRIQKVIYSAEWRGGRPVSRETGISHGFRVLKIESYEDTLNNLALTRTGEQTSLLDNLTPAVRDDYLLRYMMDVETRGSLLSLADFRKPFDYKLRVAVDSAGATEERPVDLVETFNYLIGVTVKTIDLHLDRGFAMVRGVLPDRQTALILWRDCDKLDYAGLLKLCDTLAINPADSEHDVVYVNGDHTIPTVATADDAEGGETKVLKLRQIEPAFLDAMFSMDEAS